MKIKSDSIVKAIVVIIILTILPLMSPSLLPSEFYNAISMQGGVDIVDLLNRLSFIGVALAILIVLRGSYERMSKEGFALSICWKIFLLIIVIFILSIGKVENMGFAMLSSRSNGALNMVLFDLRLIVVLAAIVVALMIARSIIEYKEIQKI
jgi:hypothetical protein